jgi:hypothetical protein
MDKHEISDEDRVTASQSFNTSQSDQIEKKKTFCKRAMAFFRRISLVDYRTPLYFDNKDSYSSASSGILTILSGLGLVVLFIIIFKPIVFMENY